MKKGFTLIELLIVIGILAILATVVILVLNPAQLFAQARDSQRISDMGTLRSALSFYLATVSTPSLGNTANCYTHIDVDATANLGCGGRHGTKNETSSTATVVDGTGWLAVNFNSVPGGSPLSVLPVDPSNTATYYYSYTPGASNTFELNANMESDRYANTGVDDVESTDGGNNANIYEIGNDPGLDI